MMKFVFMQNLPLISCHVNFLLIDAQKFVWYYIQLQKDQLQKLDYVAQQFL